MAQGKLGYTSGSGKNIATYSFVEGGQVVDIERIAPGAGIMDGWDASLPINVTGVIGSFSVASAGRGRIIVGAESETAAGQFFSYRLIFKDAVGNVIGLSAEMSPVFTTMDNGGTPAKKYAAASVVANDVCASMIEILLTALPSGGMGMIIKMSAV